jgi:hypothetical protein
LQAVAVAHQEDVRPMAVAAVIPLLLQVLIVEMLSQAEEALNLLAVLHTLREIPRQVCSV